MQFFFVKGVQVVNKSSMQEIYILAPLTFVVICLIIGAVLKFMLRNSALPYTVVLFGVGLLIGFAERKGLLNGVPDIKVAIDMAGEIDPNLILFLFLPILIFQAAYAMDGHIFKKTLVNSSLLSAPGLVISMFIVAAIMMCVNFLPGQGELWNWSYALMFGALISATDPVAVLAILNEVGVSKRFSTLVDSEAMLNDGTGIVLFILYFNLSKNIQLANSPLIQFLIVVAGGVILGYIIARICVWFLTRVGGDVWVQNSGIIIGAYVAFMLAQQFLDVSGVIALVVYGLVMGRRGREKLQPATGRFVAEFWELMAYIANTVIFIIVGVVIATQVDITPIHLLILFGIYVGVTLARAAMIYLFYPLMRKCGYGITFRESIVLTWSGLRGATGLCLAMMVANSPAIPESIREQVLFYTAGIVFLTLIINATTMRWLLNRLGMMKESPASRMLEYSVKAKVREQAIQYFNELQKNEALDGSNWQMVERFLPLPVPKVYIRIKPTELLASIRIKLLDKEREHLQQIFESGIITKNSYYLLMGAINDLYDTEGQTSLAKRTEFFNTFHEARWFRFARKYGGKYIKLMYRSTIMQWYDSARGVLILQLASKQVLGEYIETSLIVNEERERLRIIAQEIEKTIQWAQNKMQQLRRDYPSEYIYAITEKSVRMLLAHENETLNRFIKQGVVSADDVAGIVEGFERRMANLSALKREQKIGG